MKKGGNSNIEKKLEDIHYSFSEDSWDKMEMLLNEEEDKLTGGTPAPQDGHSVYGIFRSVGIILVLLIATLGASTPVKTELFNSKTLPVTQAESQVKTSLKEIITEESNIIFENDIIESVIPITLESNQRNSSVITKIPNRKTYINNLKPIRLIKPEKISPLSSKSPQLYQEPQLAEANTKITSNIWHYNLQFGGDLLGNSFNQIGTLQNRYYAGLNMHKDLNPHLAINLNYSFSIYSSARFLSSDLSSHLNENGNVGVSSDSSSTSNPLEESLSYGNSRSFFGSSNRNIVLSNSLGLSTIFKVKKWNIESGIFHERFITKQGTNYSNWGLNAKVGRQISNRIDIDLAWRYNLNQTPLLSNFSNNYSIGIGLKYKLR
jgi:hypothetical protein